MALVVFEDSCFLYYILRYDDTLQSDVFDPCSTDHSNATETRAVLILAHELDAPRGWHDNRR